MLLGLSLFWLSRSSYPPDRGDTSNRSQTTDLPWKYFIKDINPVADTGNIELTKSVFVHSEVSNSRFYGATKSRKLDSLINKYVPFNTLQIPLLYRIKSIFTKYKTNSNVKFQSLLNSQLKLSKSNDFSLTDKLKSPIIIHESYKTDINSDSSKSSHSRQETPQGDDISGGDTGTDAGSGTGEGEGATETQEGFPPPDAEPRPPQNSAPNEATLSPLCVSENKNECDSSKRHLLLNEVQDYVNQIQTDAPDVLDIELKINATLILYLPINFNNYIVNIKGDIDNYYRPQLNLSKRVHLRLLNIENIHITSEQNITSCDELIIRNCPFYENNSFINQIDKVSLDYFSSKYVSLSNSNEVHLDLQDTPRPFVDEPNYAVPNVQSNSLSVYNVKRVDLYRYKLIINDYKTISTSIRNCELNLLDNAEIIRREDLIERNYNLSLIVNPSSHLKIYNSTVADIFMNSTAPSQDMKNSMKSYAKFDIFEPSPNISINNCLFNVTYESLLNLDTQNIKNSSLILPSQSSMAVLVDFRKIQIIFDKKPADAETGNSVVLSSDFFISSNFSFYNTNLNDPFKITVDPDNITQIPFVVIATANSKTTVVVKGDSKEKISLIIVALDEKYSITAPPSINIIDGREQPSGPPTEQPPTTPSPNDKPPDESNKKLILYTIIAASAFLFIAFTTIVIVCICVACKSKKRQQSSSDESRREIRAYNPSQSTKFSNRRGVHRTYEYSSSHSSSSSSGRGKKKLRNIKDERPQGKDPNNMFYWNANEW